MSTRGNRTRAKEHHLATLLGLISVLAWSMASGQIPDEFKNLQVLPKDVGKAELLETMKGFANGLGVRCQYCHLGEEGKPLTTFDFVSDAKETKQTARLMLRMVQSINNDHLAQLGKRSTTPIRVSCVTCHHGQNRPRLLEEVLMEVVAEKGIQAGVEKYQELRKKHYGGFVYDFQEQSLNTLAQQFFATGKSSEAVEFLKLNAQSNPDSWMAYFLLAEIYFTTGEKSLAAENYRKSLSLNPNNPMAKKKLDELEKNQ